MTTSSDTKQPETIDEFFYYFMRIRKCHCRQVVSKLKRRHRDETHIQLAHRLVTMQTILSFTGGAFTRLPELTPIANKKSLRLIGITSGGYALTVMHMHLMLQIAYIFGKDIDDKKRVPEMAAVVTATLPSMVFQSPVSSNPVLSILSGGLLPAASAKLIGEAAIAYYSKT